jgi:Ser/Thr protein kinase RdoA (MazF antagonist)
MPSTLSEKAVAAVVSLHDAGVLQRAELAANPGLRSLYRLWTTTGHYLLCIHEGKPFWDLVHEKDLLLFLARQKSALGNVEVPLMIPNAAGGYFFPVNEQGNYACLFKELPGRRLGVFEIDEDICAQVGTWLARFHCTAQTFHGRKRHAHRVEVVGRWLSSFGVMRQELRRVVEILGRELETLQPELGHLVPGGTLHGQPVPESMRFVHGQLSAVGDFQYASRGPFVDDVAVALVAFGFAQKHFDSARAAGLVRAYQSIRPLKRSERLTLHAWTRYAALRLAAARIRDFEVRQRGDVPQGYCAYEHPMEWLLRLRGMSTREFRRACQLEALA